MKEFITAVEDLAEDENGKVPKLDENDQEMRDEDGNVIMDDPHVRFKLDGRLMRAYPPDEGQLAFMLATLGRGQTNDQRFASIINIMLESLQSEDADFLESRLLTRDKAKKLKIRQIEGIFEYLMEEWFGRPTQPPSDSAASPPSDGHS